MPHRRKKRLITSNKIPLNKQPFYFVEAEDRRLSILFAVKTIANHLKKNETVVLIGLEAPEQLFRMLTITGINVEAAVIEGKLFIFSSQPAIAGHLNHSARYRALFTELAGFTNNIPLDCIVIMDVDVLFNLDSNYHAHASIRQFMQVTSALGCKVLTQYIKQKTRRHQYLETACLALIARYLVIRRKKQNNHYDLQLKRKPLSGQ